MYDCAQARHSSVKEKTITTTTQQQAPKQTDYLISYQMPKEMMMIE